MGNLYQIGGAQSQYQAIHKIPNLVDNEGYLISWTTQDGHVVVVLLPQFQSLLKLSRGDTSTSEKIMSEPMIKTLKENNNLIRYLQLVAIPHQHQFISNEGQLYFLYRQFWESAAVFPLFPCFSKQKRLERNHSKSRNVRHYVT